MKNLFKKFKKMFKKSKKVKKTKKTKKGSKRSITKKKGVKFMVTVNIELGENLKDVAKKLREMADQLDPQDVKSPCKCDSSKDIDEVSVEDKSVEKKIEDAKKRVVNLVPKKTIVSKKEKVKKEEIETFEDNDLDMTDMTDMEDETEIEAESTEVETFDDADDADEPEDADNSLSLTEDIIPACKEFAKKNGEKGRSKIAAMLKELKVNSIHDLKPENYEKFLNKLNGKK